MTIVVKNLNAGGSFGGSGEELKTDYTATAEPSDYKPYRITFDLPAYGALVFAF